MPVGKQLKENIKNSDIFRRKQKEHNKSLQSFKDKGLEDEYRRQQELLEKSLNRDESNQVKDKGN